MFFFIEITSCPVGRSSKQPLDDERNRADDGYAQQARQRELGDFRHPAYPYSRLKVYARLAAADRTPWCEF
jgi:hypothetical protein